MKLPFRSPIIRGLAASILAVCLGQECFAANGSDESSPDSPDPIPPSKQSQTTRPTPILVECAPNGEFFVAAAPDGRLKCVRAADGITLRTFYQCQPRAVAFSPDSTLLVTAGAANGKPGKIKVWSLADGALVCEIHAELAARLKLSFSHDGQWLAGAGSDSRLHLWQLPEGKLRRSSTLPGDVIRTAFTQKGRAVFAICADGSTTRLGIP
jgi:WD40 repeat protein